MKCRTCQTIIEQCYYTAGTATQLMEHIQTCSACRQAWQQQEMITQALTTMPQLAPSDALQANIWQSITARQNTSGFSSLFTKQRLRLWAAAAMLLVLGVTSVLVNQEQHRPAPISFNHKTGVTQPATQPDANKIAGQNKIDETQPAKVPGNVATKQHAATSETKQNSQPVIAKGSGNQEEPIKQTKIRTYRSPFTSFSVSKDKKKSMKTLVGKSEVNQAAQSYTASSGQPSPGQTMAVDAPAQHQFRLYNNKINVNQQEAARITLSLHQGKKLSLAIYSRTGRLVKMIANDFLIPGDYEWQWQGKNSAGETVGSGIYLLLLQLEGEKPQKQQLVVIK